MRSDVLNANSGSVGLIPAQKKNVVEISSDATYIISPEQSGSIFIFAKADGIVATLPQAKAGLVYEFYVKTALTSNAYTVNADSSSDTLTGMVMSWDIADVGTMTKLNEGVATVGWSNPAAADHQFVTNKTTTGGLAGTYLKYTCITDALWHVEGYTFCSSGATLATPFT